MYRLLDWLMACLAWFFFFAFRRRIEDPEVTFSEIFSAEKLHLGLIVIPLGWIIAMDQNLHYSISMKTQPSQL